MHQLRRFVIVAILAAAFVLAPAAGEAQCVTTSFTQSCFTTMSGSICFVIKDITGNNNCMSFMSMSVSNCFISPGAGRTYFQATAMLPTHVSPTCGAVCDCGTHVIDGSDGLPVELMGFSVETEADDRAPETSDKAPADQPTD